MISRELSFAAPTTLEQALDCVGEQADDVEVLAGGMSLVPLMNLGLRRPAGLISLDRVSELAGIEVAADRVKIGAMTRHREIAEWTAPDAGLEALPSAAASIGDPHVRNRGTVGGSLAQAESYADYLPVLLALDARIRVASRDGSRTLRLGEFLRGPRETDLGAGELIVAIELRWRPGSASSYVRLARTENSAPLVTAAASVSPPSVMVAVGGATPVPFVVHVDHASRREEVVEAVAGAIAHRVTEEEDDAHIAGSDQSYRRSMAQVMGRRATTAALDRRERQEPLL